MIPTCLSLKRGNEDSQRSGEVVRRVLEDQLQEQEVPAVHEVLGSLETQTEIGKIARGVREVLVEVLQGVIGRHQDEIGHRILDRTTMTIEMMIEVTMN